MLQVYTKENTLNSSEGKDKFCFRSFVNQTLDHEQLIREIISYNSTITEADARAVLSVLNDRVKHFVNIGYKVELPFGYVYNKANGTVPRQNDAFVPGSTNHRISAVFKFKNDANEDMTKNAVFNSAGSGYVTLPVITQLCSKQKDGKESDSLDFAPLSMLCVKGKYLSFDSSDKTQGLFLVDEEKHETRLENYNRTGTNVIEAYASDTLIPGTYNVKIVTQPGTERYETYVFSKKIKITA